MLNVYPKNRPNVRDVLADPFFARYRSLIEDSQSKGESPLDSAPPKYTPSSNSSKNAISFNSLRAIKEQDSANNSLNNSINNSGNIVSIKAAEQPGGIHVVNSGKNAFHFNSHQPVNQPSNANFKKKIVSAPTSQFVSKQTFSSYSSDSGGLGGELMKVNSITSTQSNPTHFVKVSSFKKKPKMTQIEVNDKKEGFEFVQSKTLNPGDLSRKLTFEAKQTVFKKQRPGDFKNKRNVISVNGAGIRKFGSNFKKVKSPISFQKKQRVQFHSEQKPVTGFKWQGQSTQANSKVQSNKWTPKKFVPSMYKNSKLGAKLVNKNPTLASGNRVVKTISNSNRFMRKLPQTQSVGQANPVQANLISLSKGERIPTSSDAKVSFRSVRNPRSFSSSFQIQRKFVNAPKQATPENAKNVSQLERNKLKFQSASSPNQPPRTPHFLKNRPQQSLLKFLEPKIIRKNFIKSPQIGSNRILINRNNFNGTSTYTREPTRKHFSTKTK